LIPSRTYLEEVQKEEERQEVGRAEYLIDEDIEDVVGYIQDVEDEMLSLLILLLILF
jgi:hypothetical protein